MVTIADEMSSEIRVDDRFIGYDINCLPTTFYLLGLKSVVSLSDLVTESLTSSTDLFTKVLHTQYWS